MGAILRRKKKRVLIKYLLHVNYTTRFSEKPVVD